MRGHDPAAFVTSENTSRRHMTKSQLAHSVAGMKAYEERKAKERSEANLKRGDELPMPPCGGIGDDAGRTAEKLAAIAGVGRRSVERAIAVREQGIPELNTAVAEGKITVNQAEKIAKFSPASQRSLVAIENPKLRNREMTHRERLSQTRKRQSATVPSAEPANLANLRIAWSVVHPPHNRSVYTTQHKCYTPSREQQAIQEMAFGPRRNVRARPRRPPEGVLEWQAFSATDEFR